MKDGLPGNERCDMLFGEFDYDDENVVISFPEEDEDDEDYEELDEDGVPIWYDPYEWDKEIDEDRPY